MPVAAMTDVGLRRERNEDALIVAPLGGGAMLLAVADGVGGAPAGDVASALAVAELERQVRRGRRAPAARLSTAVRAVNEAILERSMADIEVRGMGSTLVCAMVDGLDAWVCNLGDSRAYVVRGDVAEQVSIDHNLAQEMVRAGEITPDEVQASGVSHVITRCLGTEEEVEPDVFGPLKLSPADTLLLCSDGLTDLVDDVSIGHLAGGADLDQCARELVDLALANGGVDNITVVLWRPG